MGLIGVGRSILVEWAQFPAQPPGLDRAAVRGRGPYHQRGPGGAEGDEKLSLGAPCQEAFGLA